MQWELVLALVITIPVIFLPVALVWFINVGGVRHAIREVLKGRMAGLPKVATRV